VPDLRGAGERIGSGSYAASAENAADARRDLSRPAHRVIFDVAAGSVWRMKDLADERVFLVMPPISPRTRPTADTAKRVYL
jgi:hypothetical protein